MVRKQIEEQLRAAGCTKFVVERPRGQEHGDYATNAALVCGMDAHELADKIKVEGVERVEVVGRFINFHLSPEVLVEEIKNPQIEQVYVGKKVMVEYTDPNPFKEFHIGHLMSNAIGESIARLFEETGAKVSRANYQGDVGVHVAKAIWAKQQKPELGWGEAYVSGSQLYEQHKEEVDALNKVIYEKSDEEVNKLYEQGRAESLEHFEKIYQMLGTKFDNYFFESETGPLGLKLVQAHPKVFEQSEGATVFRGEQVGFHTRVFVNSKGLPTYEAKELGLLEAKNQKGEFDISLTVTANEIKDYFAVVRAAAERIFPDLGGKMLAKFHGFLKLTTGKMSSRLGNVITGESLLAELAQAARGRVDVAVGAIKYAVLKQGAGRDIIFDPERSLSLEGDSGPYLQYARVRACSLLREARKAGIVGKSDFPKEIGPLPRLLIHFPEVVERAARELEPHYVTTYLTELASAFNSWYANNRVIGGDNPAYGVWLVGHFERVMSKGLHLLGIPTPEEM